MTMPRRFLGVCVATLVAASAGDSPAREASGKASYKFDFGPGEAAPGYVRVAADAAYASGPGYGFEDGPPVIGVDRGGDDPLRGDFCTSDRPFRFSVDLPEGNYDVTVVLGDRTEGAEATVKAESRRLMLERVRTEAGAFATRTFTVNVRNGRLGDGGSVRLNDREKDARHWDDKLTLEFDGPRACVCALEIVPAGGAVTVFLAGDSTVTDQPREPYSSWGQMLPRFFKPGVAVANHAESGRALRSFLAEKRLDKILEAIGPGDYLFLQFGHNDQKERGPGVGASTTYRASLEHYLKEARARGAIPVLVTPMHRRTFDDAGAIRNSLGDYPDVVRRVARDEGVALIDLHAMSARFYEALGPEGSKKAFVHFPAGSFPGQEAALKDDTHFNAYGGYELARCVVEGIRAAKLDLARSLDPDVPPFDPSRPDPVATWALPASPTGPAATPEGR
jgi:lysophospholipase L1-like esterase